MTAGFHHGRILSHSHVPPDILPFFTHLAPIQMNIKAVNLTLWIKIKDQLPIHETSSTPKRKKLKSNDHDHGHTILNVRVIYDIYLKHMIDNPNDTSRRLLNEEVSKQLGTGQAYRDSMRLIELLSLVDIEFGKCCIYCLLSLPLWYETADFEKDAGTLDNSPIM
ncbi:unnamed protein product [Ambrosiozyma monospora]|uniref:Unnamed protein product n=1 Tax=Ambrosiozyma monospora TaxID=43982 RepID=A0ACB5TM98_AMBMO|nr:unnamed protein product [Ambrosiozyma monospora]